MNKNLRTALVLAMFACASLLLIAPASAQSVYGSIFGTVTDSTGAAIPGATITVKDVAKGTVVTATSNASGDYSVPHLIPDVYDLKVTAKGFQVFRGQGHHGPGRHRAAHRSHHGGGRCGHHGYGERQFQQPELKTDLRRRFHGL